ncbi:MAG: SDR family NAD(P)-dependent oxidoreductase [Hyphomonadaceae bacterium]|nr:SDR family NAD(P)-dependent oxidoreductase [Hyphomonadaceae bacterium]
MVAVIFGTTGGIGQELALQLAKRRPGPVFGVSRSLAPELDGVTPLRADLLSDDDLETVAETVCAAGTPDLVIIATGILWNEQAGIQPEKSYRQQDLDAFQTVFAANTFGPALVAKHFLARMPREGRGVFAALSARVGSISDNRLGGWHAYRASKAALNMLIRNYAIEQRRKNPDFIAVGLHPGTVDTPLSGPFQANVPDGKLFTPAYSANCLLDVIERLRPDQSGQVLDYAGKPVPE